MQRKNLYDQTLYGERVIVDSHTGEVGTLVGFNNKKAQVAYGWGCLEVPRKEINVVDRFVVYKKRNGKKVLLQRQE